MADAEYPGTLAQFDRWFATEDACRKYLAKLRWPEGFCCPDCKSAEAWLTERALMHCQGCGRQVSVTAGTVFHGTRSSLRVWFQAMWWVTAQKNGASALGLQRILGLGSYETAWTWLHSPWSTVTRTWKPPSPALRSSLPFFRPAQPCC